MARTWRPKLVLANSHMMNSTTTRGDHHDHDPLGGDHGVVDAEESDVDRQRSALKKAEVLEAAADVEPALEEAGVGALPERQERADDDRDAEGRDHHHVDVATAWSGA